MSEPRFAIIVGSEYESFALEMLNSTNEKDAQKEAKLRLFGDPKEALVVEDEGTYEWDPAAGLANGDFADFDTGYLVQIVGEELPVEAWADQIVRWQDEHEEKHERRETAKRLYHDEEEEFNAVERRYKELLAERSPKEDISVSKRKKKAA